MSDSGYPGKKTDKGIGGGTTKEYVDHTSEKAAEDATLEHALKADPHGQYTTDEEVEAHITDHEAKADPHSQYTTEAEVDSKITEHVAEDDPHSQYLLEEEAVGASYAGTIKFGLVS